MTCNSGSVETVANKTTLARQQIDKLQEMLLSQESEHKERFLSLINDSLKKANISDGRQILFNSDIKTEYSSEFSLDKIANVIIQALNAAAKATDTSVPNPTMSPEALAAYGDLVNSVAESAKSSSQASATLSYSMTRISSGLFSFLYATSVNIQDEDTFGSEAVCSTALYYSLIQSIDDLKNQSEFSLAIIDSQSLIKMKKLQSALIDDLSNEVINIDTWSSKDTAYSIAVQRIQDRLNKHQFNSDKPPLLRSSNTFMQHEISESSLLAKSAIQKLSTMGPLYNKAIEITKNRLINFYY